MSLPMGGGGGGGGKDNYLNKNGVSICYQVINKGIHIKIVMY